MHYGPSKSEIGCLALGAIITAPLVVPASMVGGCLALPILSIKALSHKISMEYYSKKSGLKLNGKTLGNRMDEILTLKNINQLNYAKRQIIQKEKLVNTNKKIKSAAICIIPFGIYPVLLLGTRYRSYQILKDFINLQIEKK